MKNKFKTKLVSTIMIMVLVVSIVSVAVGNPTSVEAAEKAYGDTLKLNDEIKLNKTTSYEKTGVYYEDTFFTPLYNFFEIKNIVQDFLMYNEFDKYITKESDPVRQIHYTTKIH